jgi:PhoH-like ATPase
MEKKHIYVLDTNVLIHDPQALFSFQPAVVAIPLMVLQELDKFKSENTLRGRNAREVIRNLDLLRERGSLSEGVPLDNGGALLVLTQRNHINQAINLDIDNPDNEILLSAWKLKESGAEIIFISKDINMRVKADVIGMQARDYIKDVVSEHQFYKGWVTIQVPSVQLKKEIPDDLYQFEKEYKFTLNEFVQVESRHNPYNYRVFRYKGERNFIPVDPPLFKWPIAPRNSQQLMALDLLLDKNIQLATILGPAGTGKTFLALVAALELCLVRAEYEKILITRPVIPLGPDIGYLPGDIQEKLHSWMQPIYDNMDFIGHVANAQQQGFSQEVQIHQEERDRGDRERYDRRRRNQPHGQQKHKHQPHRDKFLPPLDELIRRGKIGLEAITYMRGRSIPYQYILIDEVQNLTPHEVKTLISRVGEGSKIILCGDPYQIDSPYLDFSSNGLVIASQRFKGQQLFGTVFLETSERSELSRLAGELL